MAKPEKARTKSRMCSGQWSRLQGLPEEPAPHRFLSITLWQVTYTVENVSVHLIYTLYVYQGLDEKEKGKPTGFQISEEAEIIIII